MQESSLSTLADLLTHTLSQAKKEIRKLLAYQETAAKTKILFSLASALLLPIQGAGPFSWWSQSLLQSHRGITKHLFLLWGLLELETAATQWSAASKPCGSAELVWHSSPGPRTPSWGGWARLGSWLAHPQSPEERLSCWLAPASSNPLVGFPSLVRHQAATA